MTSNTPKRSIIPAPEVQHLTTIFRRIQSGEIRVPAFQRGYVWKDDQIVQLLNSVYQGYPIGNLLLWKVDKLDEQQFHIVDEQSEFEDLPPLPFPHIDASNNTSFVLDGIQRLSTLFGAFFAPNVVDSLNIVFDLVQKVFLFSRDVDTDNPANVRLADLFVPRRLLEAQSAMAKTVDSEKLIDASLELQAAFQDYLLPIVTITSSSLDEVVEIFERVNSTGTGLSRVDFMRALTWSGDFDFNVAVKDMRGRFKENHFAFPAETIIKVVAITLGKDPTPKSMLEMRHSTAPDLHSAVDSARRSLTHVIDFLDTRCATHSYDFVPYEGQLLVLAKLFHLVPAPDEPILSVAEKWFWGTSFSETLRGKPDSYVSQYVRSVDRLVEGDHGALIQRLLLRSEDLVERRMIVGKALSTAIAATFSLQKAHSVIGGFEVERSLYMSDFSANDYAPIVPLEIIKTFSSAQHSTSAKILANICLVSKKDRDILKQGNKSLREYIIDLPAHFDEGMMRNILRSQMIEEAALEALKAENYALFLGERAKTMFDVIKRLTST